MVLMLQSEDYIICMIYALLLLYLCVCVCPHILELNRVYDVYQYIFSGEGSMCWKYIIYSLSIFYGGPFIFMETK